MTFRPTLICTAIAVIAFLHLATPAGAALVLQNNRTEWQAAVTSVIATLDFTAQSTNPSGITTYNTAAGLTVTDVNFIGYTGTPGTYALTVIDPAKQPSYNRGTGPVLVGGYGPSYVLVTLPGAGVYALALDFSATALGNNVTFTLSTGESFTFASASTNTMKFFGFTSDTPVTSIRISGASSQAMIDNFSFADPFVESVAEPQSLVLACTGIAGIWLSRRMRRRTR